MNEQEKREYAENCKKNREAYETRKKHVNELLEEFGLHIQEDVGGCIYPDFKDWTEYSIGDDGEIETAKISWYSMERKKLYNYNLYYMYYTHPRHDEKILIYSGTNKKESIKAAQIHFYAMCRIDLLSENSALRK